MKKQVKAEMAFHPEGKDQFYAVLKMSESMHQRLIGCEPEATKFFHRELERVFRRKPAKARPLSSAEESVMEAHADIHGEHHVHPNLIEIPDAPLPEKPKK